MDMARRWRVPIRGERKLAGDHSAVFFPYFVAGAPSSEDNTGYLLYSID